MKTRYTKIKGALWLISCVLVSLFVSKGFFQIERFVPWSWEKRLGALDFFSLEVNPCKFVDLKAHNAFQKIIQRIYPISIKYPSYEIPNPWNDDLFSLNVEVISGKTINAFALLGGKIYVFEGLIQEAKSPEELAGVLAHEIEHVRQRHIIHLLIQQLFTSATFNYLFGGDSNNSTHSLVQVLMHIQFTKNKEREADQGALLRLKYAEINNQGILDFFERLKNRSSVPEMLNDHPSYRERIELAKRYTYPTRPILDKNEWSLLKRGVCKRSLPQNEKF